MTKILPKQKRKPAFVKVARTTKSAPVTAATTPTRETFDQWAERYCKERGHDLAFAKKNGVVLSANSAFGTQSSGIRYRCIHPLEGHDLASGRTRFRTPLLDENGKPMKFKQPAGTKLNPYFASALDWQKAFDNPKIPLIISEGETRALAGAFHGFHVIGLGGCDGGFEAGTKRGKLHSLLQAIRWKGRKTTVIFDADISTNKRVKDAADALTKLLSEQGADVGRGSIAGFMPHAGVDDLLARYGGPALQMVCDSAMPCGESSEAGDEPLMQRADEIEDKNVTWLWNQRVPMEMLTGIVGNPGEGKSWIAINIAAEGSRGREPASKKQCEKFSTVYMSIENRPATIMQRFRSMGGDLKRLWVLTGVQKPDGSSRGISLDDIPELELAVKKAKAKLLVIDPLQSFIGSKVDMHRANETREVLDRLILMAVRLNLAVIIIRHVQKGSTTRAIFGALGSIDITAAVRSEFLVGTAADDPDNRAMVHIKHSESLRSDSLRFCFEGKDVDTKLVWRGVSMLTAADLKAPETPTKNPTKVDRAEEYLLEQLGGGEGRRVSELVTKEYDERTIQRAALKLKLVRGREGESGPWTIALPKFARKGGGSDAKAGVKLG